MNRLLLGAGLAVALVLGGCGGCGGIEPVPDAGVPPLASASASTVNVSPVTLPADGTSAATVTVTVRDEDGAPLEGVSVALASSGSGNTITTTPADSNAEGVVTFSLTSTRAEAKALTVTAGEVELEARPVVTFVPADASRLSVRVQPSNVQSGVAISPAIVIDVLDAQGNLVQEGAPQIAVALGEGVDGATLSGTLSATAGEGEASFTDLSIDRVGAGYTLVFSADGLTSVETAAFEVLAGPPARLAFVTQPPNGTAGVALPSAIELELQDAQGNRVEGTASVSLAIATGPAGATLSGTTTLQTTTGLVRFEDIVLDRMGNYTLAATAQGFMGATSASFSIGAGAAAQLAFVNGPEDVDVRDAFTVTVAVRDAAGNRVMSASDAISLSLMGTGSGALLGTATVNAASGLATFSNLSVDDEGTYTLQATSGTLSPATSAAFTVSDDVAPGAVTDLAVTATSQTTLTLGWTATGDDGALGTAQAYELRWSLAPITAANFASATAVTTAAPGAPGTAESTTVTGLPAASLVHLGLRVLDGAGNASILATVSGTTAACPAGYTGLACDTCATGFRETAPGVCEDFCTNPDPCNPAPADSCNGDVLVSHGATRTCTATTSAPFYTCSAPTQTDCAAAGQLCHDAACVANPCGPTTCTPPAATCNAQGERVTWAAACTVDRTGSAPSAVCNDTPTVTACSTGEACFEGACVDVVSATAGSLVITELHARPSAGTTPFIEVFNASDDIVDLAGLVVETVGSGAASFTVTSPTPVLLAPGAYFVFAQNGDAATNGGVTADFAWSAQTTALDLNAPRHLRLSHGTTVVDEVDFTGAAFPSTSGQAMNLSSGALDATANGSPWYWCNATTAMTGGDLGTPGAANGDCAVVVNGPVDYCVVQFPTDAGMVIGAANVPVFGRVYEPQVTNRNQTGNDGYPWLQMQLGYGAASVTPDPATWTWTAADFNAGYNPSSPGFAPNNDEIQGTLAISSSGSFLYGFRVRLLDPANGAPGAWAYCDTTGVAATPANGVWGTVTVANPAADIAAARAASNGSGLSLRVQQAMVTAVKPFFSASNDPAGFFVQGSPTGPALFVRVDASTLTPPPAPGDRVSFTITEMGNAAGLRQVLAIAPGSYARESTGNSLAGWSQEVSNATDLISGLGNYESELLSFTATIANAFASGGSPFMSAEITTAAQASHTNLRLRVLDTVVSALELSQGCEVTVVGAPMWRFNAQAQPLVWSATSFGDVTCPAPKVLNATVNSATEVVLTFDRILDASSVLPNGSQFSILPTLAVTAATVSDLREVTLTTDTQGDSVPYTITVAGTVTDQHGTPVAAPDNQAVFTGFSTNLPVCVTPSVVISQLYPGGGNSGATYKNDFVELHNRGSTPVDVTGWSVQQASATGTNWNAATLSGVIPPGGFFLVAGAGGTPGAALPATDGPSWTANLGGSGKIALSSTSSSLSGTCPTTNVVDFVGYGTANCSSGGLGTAPSISGNVNALIRASNGCQDNNNNSANFSVAPVSPRNSATAAAVCSCQ